MVSENGILLDHVLRPNPPLSPALLCLLLFFFAVANLAVAFYFVLRGAWPVVPFLGVDVALLGWAFRASFRAARREERVILTPALLRITRRQPRGDSDEVRFNPYWVRVHMDDPPQHGSQLLLWSHGKSLTIGRFLAPDLRASFADVLKEALRHAREGAA